MHHVAARARCPTAAAALIDRVGAGRMVAWGGGRVIDTAKALAAARGGEVCAVPTTLSGAEMSRGHRPAPGYEGRPNHRPVLVLADPPSMAGQPEAARRAAADERPRPRRRGALRAGPEPVAAMAALRAATLLARGVEAGDRDDLALGAVLAGVRARLGRVLPSPRALPDGGAGLWDVPLGYERRRPALRARGDGDSPAGGDRRARRSASRRSRRLWPSACRRSAAARGSVGRGSPRPTSRALPTPRSNAPSSTPSRRRPTATSWLRSFRAGTLTHVRAIDPGVFRASG